MSTPATGARLDRDTELEQFLERETPRRAPSRWTGHAVFYRARGEYRLSIGTGSSTYGNGTPAAMVAAIRAHGFGAADWRATDETIVGELYALDWSQAQVGR